MLQVRKSCPFRISAIFCQCYFMIEMQVLVTVSKFFFLGIILWKGISLFNRGICFPVGAWGFQAMGGVPHGGHRFWLGGGFIKNCRVGAGHCPTMGNPEWVDKLKGPGFRTHSLKSCKIFTENFFHD